MLILLLFYLLPCYRINHTNPPSTKFTKATPDAYNTAWDQLPTRALEPALKGYHTLVAQGRLQKGALLAIADLSQPSDRERLYLIDPDNKKVLLCTLVAHGKNSGLRYAQTVSNDPQSHTSSAGFYITQQAYRGKNGYSLRLDGIERGINDRALDRGIVIHGADYVSPQLARTRGWVGRSQGCPAVPVSVSRLLIDRLKDHHCLFIYHPSYQLKTQRLGRS